MLRDAALLRDGGAVELLGLMTDDVVFMRQIATVAPCIALALSAVAVTGQSSWPLRRYLTWAKLGKNRSTTSDDVGSTGRQIESNQSPRYTAAAARVLCYRVRPTIR